MIIVAGSLRLEPADRDRYLAAVADVARQAREADGCLDFVQAADPIDPERINIFERWESDAALERFRTSGDPGAPEPDLPDVLSAEVRRYRVAAVESP
ncbi:antibiotic biosynthesis monooxygenase family protein [Blastococcus sp. CT_GayMR16]|uniref:putative quinol monooxygenase n=1 Tax=Blastococcus sp. CT_GayMR16 TaxID=2559607 RepID=UPI0010748A62|nr:antibiotic biosynthesis monooxygenase family protein [Blastococcus sp. CT_GayMR16]TFV82769.1 antibiotic biosynthesis monooxygenase [Blastococcus sp. CT_GayMR16]